MSDAVVRRESAVEYFKELVEGALAHQRIAAGELTSFYVVNLLTGFLQRPAERRRRRPWRSGWPRRSTPPARGSATSLKQIGDQSLFMSGFFADSFHRKLVDVDYYVSIGGTAYTALSRYETDTFSSVFAELADNFVGFVDVLSEVSERASCALQRRSAAPLRAMAEDRQPPVRPAAARARRRAQRLRQEQPRPIALRLS